MKILVDLIHPANIHYFKNFIASANKNGHSVVITARKKDVLQNLLKEYNLPFIDMGKGVIGSGGMGKMIYLLKATCVMFKIVFQEKPDIILSFGSIPCSFSSFLFRVPHVSFEDTEHAKLNRKIYSPFASIIATPLCFYEKINKRHFKFNAYMELFYLHPKRFTPDESVLELAGLQKKDKIIFIRFVSWGAFHDIGQKGINNLDKVKLVKWLSTKYKVMISSESELPEELLNYKINLPTSKIHDLLSYSTLYIGEGGTMASEASMLGIPSIYINSLPLMGYLKDCEKSGLLFHLDTYKDIVDVANGILERSDYSTYFRTCKEKLIKDKIDPTSMLEWLVYNYPKSRDILLTQPEFQNNFL